MVQAVRVKDEVDVELSRKVEIMQQLQVGDWSVTAKEAKQPTRDHLCHTWTLARKGLVQAWNRSATYPVAYASRSLNRHKQNYRVMDMEALGIVRAFRHLQDYLHGHHKRL